MATSAIAAELQRKKNLGIAPTNQDNVGAYNKLTAQSPTTSAVGSYLGANNTPTSPTPARTLTIGTGDWRSTLGQPKSPAVSTAFNSMHPTSTPTPSPTFTPYKPFEYTQANIEADPEYQAALATAKQNIQTSQNNTIAGLVANGQGNSSYSAGVAQQIANKEIGNVNNNILPQLIQQAYQRHQQDFANQNQLDQQNYGVTQDTFNNGIAQGQLTGNYTSPEQQSVISQILRLKQQAEAPGITPDQRAGLSSQANVLRDQLTALGGNAAAVGADVSAANVNPYAGQRTLAGQQFDQGVKNDNLNAALQVGQQTGFNVSPQNDFGGLFRQGVTGVDSNGKPLTQNLAGQQQKSATDQLKLDNLWTTAQQTGTVPNELADMIGVPHGTQTQAAQQFAISSGQATDDNLRQWAALGLQARESGSTQGNSAVTPSQAGNYLTQLLTTTKPGAFGGAPTTSVATDYASKKKAFENAYSTLYEGTEATGQDVKNALIQAGYTPSDIAQLQKDHPDAFLDAGPSSGGSSGSVKVPQALQGLSTKYGQQYGVDSGLIDAVAQQESGYGSASNNVMQVNGLGNATKEESLAKGASMLANYMTQTGNNVEMSLAMYNMGPGIKSWMKENGITDVREGMQAFSNYQKKKLGVKTYGDPDYVNHVLRYY